MSDLLKNAKLEKWHDYSIAIPATTFLMSMAAYLAKAEAGSIASILLVSLGSMLMGFGFKIGFARARQKVEGNCNHWRDKCIGGKVPNTFCLVGLVIVGIGVYTLVM